MLSFENNLLQTSYTIFSSNYNNRRSHYDHIMIDVKSFFDQPVTIGTIMVIN